MSFSIPNSEFPSSALKEALAVALADGAFNDTVYYLFSRHTASGKVGSPRAVYANSSVMKAAAEHFRAQLGGEFSVDDEIPEETDGYAYGDDSDIEDTEDVEDHETIIPREHGSVSSSKPPIDTGAKGKAKAQVSDKNVASNTISAAADIARGMKYRVFVPDVAATTWKAMIYYIYTGTISFALLSSEGPQRRFFYDLASPKRPPPCSPKSAYRLADIVGLTSLRKEAEMAIKGQLRESSIASEIFSPFASYYPEILKAEIEFLFRDGVIARVLPQVQEHIKTVVRGDMPHAESVLCSLVSKLPDVLVPGNVAPSESNIVPVPSVEYDEPDYSTWSRKVKCDSGKGKWDRVRRFGPPGP